MSPAKDSDTAGSDGAGEVGEGRSPEDIISMMRNVMGDLGEMGEGGANDEMIRSLMGDLDKAGKGFGTPWQGRGTKAQAERDTAFL